MRTPVIAILLLATASVHGAEPSLPSPTAAYPTAAYLSLGSNFAKDARLDQLDWSQAQFDAFVEGLRATYQGRPYATNADAQQLQVAINERMQDLAKHDMRAYFADPKRLQTYMRSRAKELRLQLSDTGIAFGLMGGKDAFKPGPEDTVVISYQAVGADGQTELPTLNVSHKRVRVDTLIPGLAEGIQLLTTGGSGLFIVPPDLAYAEGAWPAGVEPGTPIIFTAVLHEIVRAP